MYRKSNKIKVGAVVIIYGRNTSGYNRGYGETIYLTKIKFLIYCTYWYRHYLFVNQLNINQPNVITSW